MNPANDNSFFTTGRISRIAMAAMFDLAKVTFGILLLLAPIIAGSMIGNAAAKQCNGILPSWTPAKGFLCDATQKVVTVGIATAGYVLEFGSGVGDAAVAFVSEIFDDAIDFMAWTALTLWCFAAGISFTKGKSASKRLIAAGASFMAGLVPLINLMPTITIGQVCVEVFDFQEKKNRAAKQAPALARAQQVAAQQEHLAALRQASNDNQAAFDAAA